MLGALAILADPSTCFFISCSFAHLVLQAIKARTRNENKRMRTLGDAGSGGKYVGDR